MSKKRKSSSLSSSAPRLGYDEHKAVLPHFLLRDLIGIINQYLNVVDFTTLPRWRVTRTFDFRPPGAARMGTTTIRRSSRIRATTLPAGTILFVHPSDNRFLFDLEFQLPNSSTSSFLFRGASSNFLGPLINSISANLIRI